MNCKNEEMRKKKTINAIGKTRTGSTKKTIKKGMMKWRLTDKFREFRDI